MPETQINKNLIKQHLKNDYDDTELLDLYIDSALSYAEKFQVKNYTDDEKAIDKMSGATMQGIFMLIAHFYDNKDGVSNLGSQAQRKKDPALSAAEYLLYPDRTVLI